MLHKPYEEIKDEKFTFSSPFKSSQDTIRICVLQDNGLSNETIIVDKRIEDSSKLILDTFNDIMRHTFKPVMENNVSELRYAKSYVERDFSSLISSLSRIIEIELNLSIVQLIRKINGIDMPQYFNKVAEEKGDVNIQKDQKVIKLNEEKKDNKLAPQSLGEICFLINIYKGKLPGNINHFAPNLNNVLHKLRTARNNASHSFVEDEKIFIDFYKNFCSIIKEGWLTELMNLKQKMRG